MFVCIVGFFLTKLSKKCGRNAHFQSIEFSSHSSPSAIAGVPLHVTGTTVTLRMMNRLLLSGLLE